MATKTAQDEVANLRLLLSETDSSNSRWDDTLHLLPYVNEGRREFSKKSLALKAVFDRVTKVGATLEGGNVEARYDLDPSIIKIHLVEWNGSKVEPAEVDWFTETGRLQTGRADPIETGTPFKYRMVGRSIDLFYAPSLEKTLSILASHIATDFEALSDPELELMDDQWKIANKWAAHLALSDDGRDSSRLVSEFLDGVKGHHMIANPRVGRGVQQSNFVEY